MTSTSRWWHRRSRRMLLAGLPVLMILCLAAAFVSWRAARSAQGRAVPVNDTQLAGVPGANLEASELAAPDLDATLAELDRAGMRWVRFPIHWDVVESARGRFDWQASDRVFALLKQHPALHPLIVLSGSPTWARRPDDAANPFAPPQERADFGAFARAVAERYGGQVQYYQVWHEPNIAPNWGARPADPEDYVGLLREAAINIRAADPDARIVLAALAPNTETGGANLSDLSFLDALYSSGARPWFDVVAAEPYGFSASPDAPASPDALNFARVRLLRDVMVRHGDGATRIWATAFGWNALPTGWTGPASPWGQVDEATQAADARQAVESAATREAWLGPLFWAATCPRRLPDDPWLGFALCGPDGAPRPVLQALSEAAAQPAVLPPGFHAPDHPAIRYASGWRVTPSAADPAAEGDALTYDFNGTATALRVQGGPYWAYFTVTVDGVAANALPRDETGASYLVLYDPLSEERLAPLAQGLPAGQHRVQVVAHGGWGQWALRGVEVGDASLGPAALPAWWLLFSVAGVLAVGWVALAREPLARGMRVADERIEALAAAPDAWWYVAAAVLVLALAFSPRLPLTLAVLAGLWLVFLVRPDVALPFIAFVIPFWPRPKAIGGFQFSLYELLLWSAAAALIVRWVLAAWGNRGRPVSLRGVLRGLDWPVAAFLAVGFLAALAAERQDVAQREFRTVFLSGVVFYALISRVRLPGGRRFSARPVVIGFLAGMAFISAVALWQYATGQGRIDVEGVGRVRAFFGSPNNLALVLDRAVPLCLALTLFGALARRRLVWRILAAAATGLMVVACVLTFSKGALVLGLPVGLAVVLVGGAWRGRRRWPLLILAAAVVLGALIMLALAQTPRFADLVNLSSGTGFFRIKLWQSAWHMFLDHPWLGVGPDNFLYAYRSRYVLPSAWQELNLSHPHDLFLDLGTRLGLFGLWVGAWAIIGGLWTGVKLVRRGDGAVWPLALGLFGGLLASLAHGLIDNSLFLIDLMAIFMFTLGLLQRLSAATTTSADAVVSSASIE